MEVDHLLEAILPEHISLGSHPSVSDVIRRASPSLCSVGLVVFAGTRKCTFLIELHCELLLWAQVFAQARTHI